MSTQEKLSGIAKHIRCATNILTIQRPLTAKHLIRLSQIYYLILGLQDVPLNILMAQLALETNNTERIRHYLETIIGECDNFCSAYYNNKEGWDEICSFSSLVGLVNREAENDFGLKIGCANEEKNKWEIIFNKYNDITRLYNSMDCRPGQGKEDMAIINMYREELWNLVGHPISLETINEEHDKAKRIRDEKREALHKLNQSRNQKAGDLLEQIEKDIIPSLFVIISWLKDELVRSIKDLSPNVNEGKRRPGRPKKEEEYALDAISDFASCFVDSERFNIVKKQIEKSDNPLSGVEVSYLFEVLKTNNWIKPSLESAEKFADLLIGSMGDYVSIKKGRYVYSGRDDPSFRGKWRDLLGLH